MEGNYQAIELLPGLYSIEEGGVRSFLVEGDEKAYVIDTGFGTGDLKGFLSTITKLPVEDVLHTHTDGDHTGCNHQFARIWMHPAEFDRYAEKGCDCTNVLPLWEGDVIRIGHYNLEVVLIPGHTPGSIAFLEREHRFLISGDTVQNSPVYMFGAGRNMPAFLHTIDKLLGMADAFDTIYPSHGTLPETPDVLKAQKQGALDVLAGLVTPQPPFREGMPCNLYDCGRAKFLYQPKGE